MRRFTKKVNAIANNEAQEIEQPVNSASRKTKEQLEHELADAHLLQKISIELIQENNTAGLYKKIVEAAVAIMGSQYASMQMLVSEKDSPGKLRLLASSGFSVEAENFWKWVYHNTGSSCGEAFRRKRRAVISDFTTCEFMKDAPTLPVFLNAGIYAAQSTPLYSRDGRLLGMISTHWNYPHTPTDRDLSLLDVLARQAADLIDRTQATEALRQSEERLRALTTATNDVIYRMSPDWSEMYHMDGRNFLAHTGSPLTDWVNKYLHPDDVSQVLSVVRQAIEGKSIYQLEHRILKADNNYGWTFSRAIPIMDENNEIIEWFGAASDITEKRSLMTTLENKVAERTSELQRSNEDLQKFAHVASHDLKEPVRKIKTFGLRMKEELTRTPNETLSRYNTKILESAGRMTTMIEGVLNYSSLNGTEQIHGDVDLNEVIGSIRSDLEILIQQKGAEFTYASLPVVQGIEVLIYQMFYNVINNSLKFSKADQRPLIAITSEELLVEGREMASISIQDNGIGFDPKFNETIFKTFTRLNPKSTYEGTGLGLSLAKNIAERHGGTIQAMGRKNLGTTISITLPI